MELCVYSMLVTFYKIGEVHFRLLGANGFHAKAKNEKVYCCWLALLSEPQKCKFHVVTWQTTSKFATKSVPHVQHTIFFPRSTNQIIHLWRCRYSMLSLLKLPCIITFKISVMPEVFFFTAIKRKDTSCRYCELCVH